MLNIILMPFISSFLLGLCSFLQVKNPKAIKSLVYIACLAIGISACLTVIEFVNIFILQKLAYSITLFNWIDIANLQINFRLQVDQLCVFMMLIISIISFLVSIYSIEYMKNEVGKLRFFTYLCMFVLAMYVLVAADNLLVLFLAWELISVMSFLLISFWYDKPKASFAGLKAFMINRIADLAFILAIIFAFAKFGSLDLDYIFSMASYSITDSSIIALLLFFACMAKSAQCGLHTWLPNAMEGPTPVSALIHSATMVSAGVFLVCRLSGLYEFSNVLPLVCVVGMVTCIFSSLAGLAQTDIKKLIAYSTSSQYGFMFFACGLGAYNLALAHLMVHAVFKSLLFLSAGRVIYACAGQQNINLMGGVKKYLPYSFVLMWIGTIALLFVPTKEEILNQALASESFVVYVLALVATLLTAVYSIRLMFKVFYGQENFDADQQPHLHDGLRTSLVAMFALVVLLFIAIITSKYIQKPINWNDSLTILKESRSVSAFYNLIPIFVTLFGAFLAYKSLNMSKYKFLYNLFYNNFYIDNVYNFTLIKPYKFISKLVICFDKFIIDEVIHIIVSCSLFLGQNAKKLQTGLLNNYILIILISIAVFAGLLILIL